MKILGKIILFVVITVFCYSMCSYGLISSSHLHSTYCGEQEFASSEQALEFQNKLLVEVDKLGASVISIDFQKLSPPTITFRIDTNSWRIIFPYGEPLVSAICAGIASVITILILLMTEIVLGIFLFRKKKLDSKLPLKEVK